jgi:hypothetical protein
LPFTTHLPGMVSSTGFATALWPSAVSLSQRVP